MNQTKKSAYKAPTLRAHGSIEKITHGRSSGAATDAAFPAGTPFSDLTFS